MSKSLPELPPFRVPGSPDHINDHDLLDEWLAAVKDAFYKGSGYSFPAIPDPAVHGNPGHVEAHNRLRACAEYMKATDYATDSSFPPIPAEADEGEQGHVVAHNEFRDVFAYIAANRPKRYNVATGGTVTDVEDYNGTGQTWRVHTFTRSGTFTVTTADQPFRVLIVGGSGPSGVAAGGYTGGGGGGGGVYANDGQELNAGAAAVVVGSGGSRGSWPNAQTPPSGRSAGKPSSLDINGVAVTCGGGGTGSSGPDGGGGVGPGSGANGGGEGYVGGRGSGPGRSCSGGQGAQLISNITGSDDYYSCSGHLNTGGGNHPGCGAYNGQRGIVIVAYQIG